MRHTRNVHLQISIDRLVLESDTRVDTRTLEAEVERELKRSTPDGSNGRLVIADAAPDAFDITMTAPPNLRRASVDAQVAWAIRAGWRR